MSTEEIVNTAWGSESNISKSKRTEDKKRKLYPGSLECESSSGFNFILQEIVSVLIGH